jgi:hypothetical protein
VSQADIRCLFDHDRRATRREAAAPLTAAGRSAGDLDMIFLAPEVAGR